MASTAVYVADGGSSSRRRPLLLLLLAAAGATAQPQPAAATAGPITLPLTYRSQRPLADAAPLRRHKAQVIGAKDGKATTTTGQFLGIDRMHVPLGDVALHEVDFVAVRDEGTNAVKVCGWVCVYGSGG
jgi:hypothetical protein